MDLEGENPWSVPPVRCTSVNNVSAFDLECSYGPQNGLVHSKTPDLQSVPAKQCLENSFRVESSQILVHYFTYKKLGIVLSEEKSSRLTF